MTRKRWAAALAATAASLVVVLTPQSADASAGGTVQGTMHFNCFGCGTTSGSADLRINGQIAGRQYIQARVTATFTAYESPLTCPTIGNAQGSFSGAWSGTFTWTRTGASVMVTTVGDVNGVSTLALVPVKPVVSVSPCGQALDLMVVGTFAGA
jgi:hypothetical protein